MVSSGGWGWGGGQTGDKSAIQAATVCFAKQPAGRRELLRKIFSVLLPLPFSAECCGGKGDRHRCYWLRTTPPFNTPSPNRMQPKQWPTPSSLPPPTPPRQAFGQLVEDLRRVSLEKLHGKKQTRSKMSGVNTSLSSKDY